MSAIVGYIPGLDGIRALGVLLVFGYHLNIPFFDAGFLGVDIFFVLSGFLITKLLLDEINNSGRISLLKFWSARVRRLIPALITVVAAVLVFAQYQGTYSTNNALRGDVWATLFYYSNWQMINSGDYFVNDGLESPLEHTWSLAIEEQFYIGWPILILLCYFVFRRFFKMNPIRGVAFLAIAMVLVSATLSIASYGELADQEIYMGTQFRMFQPLMGAAAACLLFKRELTKATLKYMSFLGWLIAVVTISLVSFSAEYYFKGGSLFIAVGSLLVIVSLSYGNTDLGTYLVTRIGLQIVGKISYGLYLWHWPLILWFVPRELPLMERIFPTVATVFLGLTISFVSYKYIENPIRKRHVFIKFKSPVFVIALAFGSLVSLGTLANAVTAPSVPSNNQSTVVSFGDSVVLRMSATFERIAEDRGFSAYTVAKGGCTIFADYIVTEENRVFGSGTNCRSLTPLQDDIIQNVKPDWIVFWDRFALSDVRVNQVHYKAGSSQWWDYRQQKLESTLFRFQNQDAKVLFILVEPPGTGIETRCLPVNCTGWNKRLIDRYGELTTNWNNYLMETVKKNSDSLSYLDLTPVVCEKAGSPCLDSKPLRPDGIHYSEAGNLIVSNQIIEKILQENNRILTTP